MRFALLPATLLAACAMSTGAVQAGLNCPEPGDALTVRLCAALRQELDRSDTPAPRLTLQVHRPRPDMLRARLSLGEGAARRDGPEIELSVMDRTDIPDAQLKHLARLLLERTLPSRQ